MSPASTVHGSRETGGARRFDVDSVLANISDGAPAGDDLRGDASNTSPYQALRTVRTAARNNERAALAGGDPEFVQPADWLPVVEGASRLLEQHSKDLEVTAWLIEALTRTDGFRGVAAGFTVAEQLLRAFGESLHPRPDEEGRSTQVAALVGLNGQGSEGALIAPLRAIPLTAAGTGGRLCAWQCEQAFVTERVGDPERRRERAKRGFATREDIDRAVRATGHAHFRELADELAHAIAAYDRYCAALDAHCADDPQPTSRIRDALNDCQRTLKHIAGERLGPPEAGGESEGNTPDRDLDDGHCASGMANAAPADGAIGSRAQAVGALRQAADYFRRAEPHSPVSYAIEQAIRWAGLSLPELIDELIPDADPRRKYRVRAGLGTRED